MLVLTKCSLASFLSIYPLFQRCFIRFADLCSETGRFLFRRDPETSPLTSWQRASSSGEVTLIEGAAEMEYEVTSDDVGSRLRFEYQPVSEAGAVGESQFAETEVVQAGRAGQICSSLMRGLGLIGETFWCFGLRHERRYPLYDAYSQFIQVNMVLCWTDGCERLLGSRFWTVLFRRRGISRYLPDPVPDLSRTSAETPPETPSIPPVPKVMFESLSVGPFAFARSASSSARRGDRGEASSEPNVDREGSLRRW